MFDRYYAAQCLEASRSSICDRSCDADMLQVDFKHKFTKLFTFLEGGTSSRQIRCEEMASLAPQLKHLKTTRTCLFCLASCPEHLLVCGHSISDTCVRVFGEPPFGKPYHFGLSTCLLCLARVDYVAREELATINPCVLSIDGGGIKGCIALAFLSALQEALGPNIPLQGYFDLFVGTSSGSSVPYRTIAISELAVRCHHRA
jgi:hypothetical protein